MFVLSKKKLVWWPVKVPVPQDDGSVQIREFKAQFEILPNSRIDELTAEAQKAAADAFTARTSGEESVVAQDLPSRVLNESVRNWKDVEDEETKAPIPFDAVALAQALEFAFVKSALWQAYTDAAAGRKAKN